MLSSFISNPELKRNVWLEITPTRLLIMPLVQGPLYLLAYLLGSSFSSPENAISIVKFSALFIFTILLYIWGNRQASDAIISEVNGQTWHFQKMTSIGPMQMAIGKLFGSTIYAWYGAAIAGVVYLATSITGADFINDAKTLLLFTFTGIFSHALCISLTLISIRKKGNKPGIKSFWIFLICMLLAYSGVNNSNTSLFASKDGMVDWYGINVVALDFNLLGIMIYAAWAIVGLQRSIRTELQFENKPWVWLGFIVFSMVYQSGFLASKLSLDAATLAHLTAASLIPYVLTYFMALTEPKNPVDFRQILQRAKEGDWDRVLKNLPLWLLTYAVTLFMGLLLIIVSFMFIDKQGIAFTMIVLSVLLLLTRDLTILLFFNFSQDQKRADITSLVFFFLLYILIPSVLTAAGLSKLLPAFYPDPGFTRYSFIGILLLAIEVVGAAALMIIRWKSINKELSEKYDKLAT